MDITSLITRAQKGDRHAFGVLYDQTVASIYGFLYYTTLRREVAEDLTSITYIKALECISTFTDRGEGSFRAWLYAIARNTSTDHFRKATTVPLPEDMDIPESIPSARRMEAQADLAAAQRELEKLPPPQRDIIIMRIWQDLSFRDIAATLGKTEASCKMMFSRAIRDLRTRLPLTTLLFLLTLHL